MPDAEPDPPGLPAWQTETEGGVTLLVLGDAPGDATGEWLACDAAHVVTVGDMV